MFEMITRLVAFGIRSLERPLSKWWCAASWVISAAIFVGLVRLLGGPTSGDAGESTFSTWAIAHGQFACSYPAWHASGIAPLYPLVSGALAGILRIGSAIHFPSQAALGQHCSTAITAIAPWYVHSGALGPTIRVGYVSWLALMVGVIAMLRACGRGRRGWEPATLVLLACAPPVLLPLQELFHPEDLLAVGIAMGAIACARSGQWVWTGALLGLAFITQQFTLLVAAPLIVLAPRGDRAKAIGASFVTVMFVLAPMFALTSGRLLKAMSGSGAPGVGGTTVLAEAHLSGIALLFVSRALPIALAMGLAWWAAEKLGSSALEPAPLMSLMAASMLLRLLFEVSLFGYYFMAASVFLIVLDVVRRRFRWTLVSWIASVTVAFDPIWGDHLTAFALPIWLWQLILVPVGVALAARPLVSAFREHHPRPAAEQRSAPRLDALSVVQN
jgi:hypothetical protein